MSRWLLGAGTCLLLASTLNPAADEVVVRFTSPPRGQPVSGNTLVAVEATAPAGSRIERVDVFIDGQQIASLENPPFQIEWGAGPDFRAHHLRAVAITDTGQRGSAVLRTPELRVGQRESVHLVNVYLNVVDRKGRPLVDLTQADFTVYEEGLEQPVTHFSSSRQPLSVALLLDASNSMGRGRRMEIAQKAAIDFLKESGAEDQVLVISFNDAVKEVQGLTTDRKALQKAIKSITPGGGTALYDALTEATARLKGFEGRKVVVLLSDGRDQAYEENAPGSLHLFDEAVESAIRREVAIYAIGLGADLEKESDLSQRWSLREILETFARKTGGRFYNPARPGQLSDVYEQVSEDLSRQYLVAYSPLNVARDGKWRKIRVEVNRVGATVLHRPGYYAPSP